MTETLLLIDDNAVQAITRQTILKRAGYLVIAALNPGRALEQFRENDFPLDVQLVITDHVMPGMNGSDFVRELRKIRPTLPVLVISGMQDAQAEYEGLGVEFRAKPLMPESLLESVQKLVRPSSNSTGNSTAERDPKAERRDSSLSTPARPSPGFGTTIPAPR